MYRDYSLNGEKMSSENSNRDFGGKMINCKKVTFENFRDSKKKFLLTFI